eukprot:TCONS_00007772-protein
MTENNLLPVDMTHGYGPCYTYQHLTLPNQSYIDHILIPSTLSDYVTDTHVVDPHPDNTGDHIPVSATFRLPDSPESVTQQPEIENDFVPNYIWKNEKFLNLYHQKVTGSLENYVDGDPQSQLDNLHLILQHSAGSAYTEIEKTFYNFSPKRWWNNELGTARNTLQQMFNLWKSDCFTKDPSSISYNRYKFARKRFRTLVKRAKHKSTIDHFVCVDKLKNVKPKTYWNQMQALKSSSQKLYTINGKTNKDDITTEFKEHFDNLLNTPRVTGFNNSISNKTLLENLTALDTKEPDF